MKDSKDCAIIILGNYSLIKEGICRVLQLRGFHALAYGIGAGQLRLRAKAQRSLFIIVHGNEDFGSVVSEIGILKDQFPEAAVAVIAEHHNPDEPGRAFAAGASGYILNRVSSDVFVKSVELVMLGETVFPPAFTVPYVPAIENQAVSARLADKAASQDLPFSMPLAATQAPILSPRESAILRCLIEGDSNKFIARKIQIAEATVKAHVKAILRKVRVQNRTQAAIWGMNNAVLLHPANSNSLLAPIDAENI